MDRATRQSIQEVSVKDWAVRPFPNFWTILLAAGIIIGGASFAANSPELVQGWRGMCFVVLLIIPLVFYYWLSQARIYGTGGMSERTALALIGVQLVALLILVHYYDVSFIWLGVSVLYQIIGGMPPRRWLFPLAGLVVILIVSALPADNDGSLNGGLLVSGIALLATNFGIALFIRSLGSERDHLHFSLERLRQAYETLTASTAQAEELAVLRERTRLARTMHDEIGHALVVINVKLEAAQLLYAHDAVRGDAELEAARKLIRTTMTDLRSALTDLRAPVTAYDDLPAALGKLVQESETRIGLVITCTINGDDVPPPAETRRALWSVAREALTNIERHAGASRVTLAFEAHPTEWVLRIEDDGVGITPADLQRPRHYGLIGMREHIQAVGGILTVQAADRGTVVEARVPRKSSNESESP